MNNDNIELNCPHCNEVGGELPFDESFKEKQYTCSNCGKEFLWLNCQKCETGYTAIDKSSSCPGCLDVTSDSDDNSVKKTTNQDDPCTSSKTKSSGAKIPPWAWVLMILGMIFVNLLRSCGSSQEPSHIIINSTDLTEEELNDLLELGAEK